MKLVDTDQHEDLHIMKQSTIKKSLKKCIQWTEAKCGSQTLKQTYSINTYTHEQNKNDWINWLKGSDTVGKFKFYSPW